MQTRLQWIADQSRALVDFIPKSRAAHASELVTVRDMVDTLRLVELTESERESLTNSLRKARSRAYRLDETVMDAMAWVNVVRRELAKIAPDVSVKLMALNHGLSRSPDDGRDLALLADLRRLCTLIEGGHVGKSDDDLPLDLQEILEAVQRLQGGMNLPIQDDIINEIRGGTVGARKVKTGLVLLEKLGKVHRPHGPRKGWKVGPQATTM